MIATEKNVLAIGDILSASVYQRRVIRLVIEVPNRIDTIREDINHHANDVMRHYHFFDSKARRFALHDSAVNLSSMKANITLKGVYGYALVPYARTQGHCQPTRVVSNRVQSSCHCK